jgi:hypothetical protein
VRFARLMQRRVPVLGGPVVRAAYGGNPSLTWLPLRVGGASPRCRPQHGEGIFRVGVAHRFTRLRTAGNARPSKSGPASRSTIRNTSPAQLTHSVSALLTLARERVLYTA